MDDHLAKLVSIHDLKAALQRWLEPAGPQPRRRPCRRARPPPQGRPALDLGRLRDLIGDDPSLVAQFLADFRIQLQDTAQAPGGCPPAQRPDEVRRLAHHLGRLPRVSARCRWATCAVSARSRGPAYEPDTPAPWYSSSSTRRRVRRSSWSL